MSLIEKGKRRYVENERVVFSQNESMDINKLQQLGSSVDPRICHPLMTLPLIDQKKSEFKKSNSEGKRAMERAQMFLLFGK